MPRWTPDQIREEIRKKKAEGADLIKIFASLSIRDGGAPTMSQEQMDAGMRRSAGSGAQDAGARA